VKLAGFLLILACAVPAVAQSGLDHGHKIGSNIAYLEDSPGGAQAQTAEILSNLQIQFSELIGNARGSAVPNPRPCAAFETWAEQTTSDFAESAGTGVTGVQRTAGKIVMQRFVRDNLRQVYASYTVIVETLSDPGTYRVSFGPPDPPVDISGKADWKLLAPQKYPVPQIMRDDDSVRLELYSNRIASDVTQKVTRRVVDYVHVGRQDRMIFRKETPHDSYAEDAELALTQPRFRVNGATDDAVAATPETIRGPVLWVYVPGHGRFILSLHPYEDLRFQEAGEVAGNSLTFTAPDGNLFQIGTAERIAPGSGAYAVHVRPDAGWMPADPQDRARVMIGAALGVVGQ
jgi:hypothetical protein